jgi:hypothetical protein
MAIKNGKIINENKNCFFVPFSFWGGDFLISNLFRDLSFVFFLV